MDNRIIKFKLIVAHGKCLNCGTERILSCILLLTLHMVKELFRLKVGRNVLMQISLATK